MGHIIIGGGPAATNAIETIRQFGDESEITLISDEPAHSRMALPYWLAGQIPLEQTHTGNDAYFQNLRVTSRFGVRVDQIDPAANRVSLAGGESLPYDQLLIATGSSPTTPDFPGADLPGVQPMWSIEHTARAIDELSGMSRPRVVLVGAGFIGFIVLNALFKRGSQLTVVERESHVLPRMLDRDSAETVERWLGNQDIAVQTGTSVQSIEAAADGTKTVRLESGDTITADLVVVATGIRANLDLAASGGLDTADGILVNDRMQSSVSNIYAAGDVAQGPMLLDGDAAIHAIQPTAVDHGRVAGANMAGHVVSYPGSLLMNVVDVCGLQCASYGHWDDAAAESMTISNPSRSINRRLLWRADRIVGAIFTGHASDVGMLNDVGMVKGIIQTQTPMGPWKSFLADNPFDIRRAYIGAGVAGRLIKFTLLGRPTKPRAMIS